jgi:hypothetical protein
MEEVIDTAPLPTKFASGNLRWQLEDCGDQLELVPRAPFGYLASCVAAVAVLTPIGIWFIPCGEADEFLSLRNLWLVFLPLFLVGSCVMTYLDYRLGPRFLVDRVRQTLSMPSIGRTWPIADVVGWQLIIRPDLHRSNKKWHRCQMILLVRENDSIARYLLMEGVGSGMIGRIESFVADSREQTGLTLVSHVAPRQK